MSEFSAAERKIIDAARDGTLADFRKDGERRQRMPNIEAEFLARLWAGWIENCVVHPRGLRVAGIRIKGDFDVHSNPHRDGFETLAYIELMDCRFDGLLNLTSCSIKGARFEKCEFGVGQSANVTTYDQSIEATSARFEENLVFNSCRFPASLELIGIHVGQDLQMSECRAEQPLALGASTIAASLRLEKSTFLGGGLIDNHPFGFAVLCENARIGHDFFIDRCRFENAARFNSASLGFLRVEKSHFHAPPSRHTAFSINASKIEAGIFMHRCLIEGSLDASGLKSEGEAIFVRIVLGGRARYAHFSLSTAEMLGPTMFNMVRVSDGLSLRWARMDGPLIILNSHIKTPAHGGFAIEASSLRAGETIIDNCRLAGSIAFNDTKIAGNFFIVRSAILPEAQSDKHRTKLSEMNADGVCRFNTTGCNIAGYLLVDRSLLVGHTDCLRTTTTVGAQFVKSAFLSSEDEVSLSVQRFTTEGPLIVRGCYIAHGLDLYGAKPARIDIEGCIIGCYIKNGVTPYAIWADDCEIERDLSINRYTVDDYYVPGRLTGALFFSHARIGGDVIIASSSIELSKGECDDGYGTALVLNKAQVGGDVIVGFRAKATNARHVGISPPSITGAFILDDARIGGDVVVSEATLIAVGEVRRPQAHFNSEERVGLRKRGVALSLRDAKVDGELYIGRPAPTDSEQSVMLGGIVDLRDARVDLIADGGGDRWIDAGLQPGHLLLDGLTFRDLDDVGEEDTSPGKKGDDHATRRLRWLDLQFPERKATPDTFVPQPYEQLASIFAAEGNERARRKVQVAKRNLQRKHGRLGMLDRAMQWVLMVVSEYGYQPGRALGWTLGFVFLGTLATMALESQGAIILSSVDGQPKAEFSAFVYALDSAIPIIDLDQDSGWTIDRARLPRWLPIEAVLTVKALYEIIGMLLVSITVLTLTGTLREKD